MINLTNLSVLIESIDNRETKIKDALRIILKELQDNQTDRRALAALIRAYQDGIWKPAHLTNTAAPLDSVYYSLDNANIVYKGQDGVVSDLH